MRVMKMKFRYSFFCVLLAVLMLFSACRGESKSEKSFFAMDTYISVTVYGDDAENNTLAAEALIKELDARYGINSVGGEVYALNFAGGSSKVSEGLLEMLSCAKTLWESTNGAYDVTAKPFSSLWGFTEGENRVPSDSEITAALALVGMEKVAFGGESVWLSNGAQIDLGSCAKGYAAQKAAELLKERNVSCAIISLGGNVQTVGAKPDGKPFSVAISDPKAPTEILGVLKVGETAVVTSGTYQRYFEQDGKRYHHIFDARTGKPCDNGLLSVTVVCENGLLADTLSTALFLLGEDGAMEYYRTYGGFEAVIVSDDGSVTVTDGLRSSFELTANGYTVK